MKRLFLSIHIPNAFCKILHDACRQLPLTHTHIVPEQNIHISIAFLGNVGEDEIENLNAPIDGLVKPFSSFTLSFERMGFGPTDERPYMIWAFFEKSPEFLDLCNTIKKGLYIKDEKNAPHTTLARFKTRPNHITFPIVSCNPFPVTAIHLMESRHNG